MTTREIRVYRDLMGANDEWAMKVRDVVMANGIKMLNLIGSPGAGKTRLLESMVPHLNQKIRFAVLEGDVETTNDAERLHALDVPVSQLLSGGSCHLEAKMVHKALTDMPVNELNLVFVENVGNMVCPAEFDIGEHSKVAVLSVTEGEDKPLKYPLLFREADAVVLTKIDLLPHLTFDLNLCRANIEAVHAGIPVFEVSGTTGVGIEEWTDWVVSRRSSPSPA